MAQPFSPDDEEEEDDDDDEDNDDDAPDAQPTTASGALAQLSRELASAEGQDRVKAAFFDADHNRDGILLETEVPPFLAALGLDLGEI